MAVGFKVVFNLQLTDHVVTTFTNHAHQYTQYTSTIAAIHTRFTTDQRATLLQTTKPSCTNQLEITVIKGESGVILPRLEHPT